MANRDGITKTISPRTGKVSWRARASWMQPDGTRRHRSKSFPTKRAAEKWRRDTLAKVDRGQWFEPDPVTLGELAERWLRTVDQSLAPSTAYQYRHTWDHLLAERLGHRKASTVAATEIQALYDALGQRYRPNTVRMCHKVLKGIFGHAITDGLLQIDPTANRRLPRHRQPPAAVWTAEQTRRFLDCAEDHAWGPLFSVLVATGIRLGEAQALRWQDVDLDARTIAIHRTAQVSKNGWHISDTPKTGTSTRTVVLPARAVLALHRQRAQRDPDVELVFPGVYGGLLPGQTARQRLTRLCELAGVPRLTPHSLRRTAATLMMQQGIHPKVAAAQLGHSVELMLERYTVVSTALQAQAAASLDDVLNLPDPARKRGS